QCPSRNRLRKTRPDRIEHGTWQFSFWVRDEFLGEKEITRRSLSPYGRARGSRQYFRAIIPFIRRRKLPTNLLDIRSRGTYDPTILQFLRMIAMPDPEFNTTMMCGLVERYR